MHHGSDWLDFFSSGTWDLTGFFGRNFYLQHPERQIDGKRVFKILEISEEIGHRNFYGSRNFYKNFINRYKIDRRTSDEKTLSKSETYSILWCICDLGKINVPQNWKKTVMFYKVVFSKLIFFKNYLIFTRNKNKFKTF